MYYSLFQENDYLHTGRNCSSKEDAIEEGIEYCLTDKGDMTKKEENSIRNGSIETKESFLAGRDIIVDEHEEILPNGGLEMDNYWEGEDETEE